MLIREEIVKDYEEVYNLIKEAFANEEMSDHDEQNLVNRLRKSDEFIKELSIVAEDDGKIVGHIMMTKINIVNESGKHQSLALAPVSVLPKHQGKGIGSLLIKNALEEAKQLGYGSVIVLGHDKYYPKFGFEKASKFNIKAPFEVPDEVFMALELKENSLKDVSGIVEYSNSFFS